MTPGEFELLLVELQAATEGARRAFTAARLRGELPLTARDLASDPLVPIAQHLACDLRTMERRFKALGGGRS
jgi:hypothetical protein